jgi:hypothetical protein
MAKNTLLKVWGASVTTYIREETNKISSPFDIYTAWNEKHTHVDEWTKQVKKGAAKNSITIIDKKEAIVNNNCSNSFDILSDNKNVDPTGTELMEMIDSHENMSASQAENEAKTTAFDPLHEKQKKSWYDVFVDEDDKETNWGRNSK